MDMSQLKTFSPTILGPAGEGAMTIKLGLALCLGRRSGDDVAGRRASAQSDSIAGAIGSRSPLILKRPRPYKRRPGPAAAAARAALQPAVRQRRFAIRPRARGRR